MLSRRLPIAQEYDLALLLGLTITALCGSVCAACLDGGELTNLCWIAATAYWPTVVIVILHRPLTPRGFDLFYLSVGFIFVFALTIFLVNSDWPPI